MAVTDTQDRLPAVVLEHRSGSRAEIRLQGAQVTGWREPGGAERLFLSRRSRWEPGIPIRGGIPVIFPQFADRGPLPKHGFARVARWEVIGKGAEPDGPAWVRLRLTDTGETRSLWPHPFRAELRVALDEGLDLELEVANPGAAPLEFTAALHSYFRVADVKAAAVQGLEGARYLDKARDGTEGVQNEPTLHIRGEVDRVYADAPDRLRIETGDGPLWVHKRGFPDAVVWNPGPELARDLDDLGDEEFREMLCVEAARVERPVRLAPGETWTGGQLCSRTPSR